MSWYKTGTVNVTNGSNIVTGVGTQWANQLSGVSAGRMLLLQSSNQIEIYEIASVQSDTQLTLADNYEGATARRSYKIPTSPTISIEQFALEISSSLSYYQKQLDSWQKILTGTGDIELTAPDGQSVIIKSQQTLNNEVKKINENGIGSRNILSNVDSFQLNGFGFIDKTTKGNKPFEYAEIIQSGDGKTEAVQIALDFFNDSAKIRSGRLSKWGEWVDFITTTNASADIVGALPAVKLGDSPIYMVGSHVVFKDAIGDQRFMPFRRDELPFGWYFRNGDNYLLSSPQGQVLNGLSINYKNDHCITIKTINGQQYINVPTAFAPDGRGFFERAVNGTTRQVGSWEDDAIREIWGHFDTGVVRDHYMYATGAFAGVDAKNPYNSSFQASPEQNGTYGYDFNASRVVPTANENRPLNIGMTPVIYLGV